MKPTRGLFILGGIVMFALGGIPMGVATVARPEMFTMLLMSGLAGYAGLVIVVYNLVKFRVEDQEKYLDAFEQRLVHREKLVDSKEREQARDSFVRGRARSVKRVPVKGV